jgi:hypothetical protein
MDTQLNALPTLAVLARTVSGCVNSAFLDISQHFTGHLFRPWIPSSARGGNTSCPHSDRFWLRELRVSQHFSTFYGPSVQAMDTQLGARCQDLLSSLGPFLAA